MGDWEEGLFRFTDVNIMRVIYNRKAGATQNDEKEFEKFLMGTYSELGEQACMGFTNTAQQIITKENPADGFATIFRLYHYTSIGITEGHADSDR